MIYRGVAALLLTLGAVPAAAQVPPAKQPGRWAQDYTGRRADPAVRFGTLANGLRYAIMHNETPTDGIAMRMRIGSGSLQERDDEQGLAHFLEHMAFRGSANIADGQVVQMLQRQGLQFGADTNAFTTQDETVYMFNFPKADAAALDTGLTLFREIGGRLNLAPAAIDAERGVILSEERLRDTAPYRMIQAEISALLKGTRAPDRWPIGKPDVIKSAGHDRFERFYRANYRPDNATIVVIGNIDAAAVEQQIRSRFADWKAAGPADTVDLGTPAAEKRVAEIVAPGVPDQVALDWVGPVDRRAETEAVDREMLLKLVALTVLNQRLGDRALQPASPFVSAHAVAARSLMHAGSVVSIEIAGSPAKWQEALDAVSAEQRMLLRDGIQAGELQRAVGVVRTQLETKARAASTRKSPDIADAVVNAVNEDELFTSAAQDLAFSTPMLAAVTPAEVSAALKATFAERNGPILFRSAQQGPAGPARLAAALDTAYSRPIGAGTRQAAITWPYDQFGPAGAVTSRKLDARLGATLVHFANGTRLLVKPTAYEKDRVSVSVLFGNGRAGVPAQLTRAIWQAQLFPLGGTKRLPVSAITQWAQENSKLVSVGFQAGNRAFALGGTTRPADLLPEMQLLDAYAREPGFRPEAVEKARSLAPMVTGQIAANPGAVYARGAQALMVGNDAKFELLPREADLARIDEHDLPQLLERPLAGAADVIMVGDVTVDQAIQATQATFAAGAGGARSADILPRVTAVQGRQAPYVFQHGGRPDQAFYGEYFALPDYLADPKTAVAADVVAAIIHSRLVDTVREKLGITYSPQVQALTAIDLPGEGYLSVTLETPPANFASFHALLTEQLRNLASAPVSADELARAKQPLIETARKQRETNLYWATKLAEIVRDPRVEDVTLGEMERLTAISAADVKTLVARFVAGHEPVTVISRGKT